MIGRDLGWSESGHVRWQNQDRRNHQIIKSHDWSEILKDPLLSVLSLLYIPRTNMNATNDKDDSVNHSQPIPMTTHHWRHRSTSLSSDSSTLPGSSPPQVQTPLSSNSPGVPVASPSSSPILSFLSHSPTAKSPSSLPYRGFGPQPVFEGRFPSRLPSSSCWFIHATVEDTPEELPATAHARRSSTAARFAPPIAPESQLDRSAGLLRRLSLGNALAKVILLSASNVPFVNLILKPPNMNTTRSQSPPRPNAPPNSAVTPTATTLPPFSVRRAKRSATVSIDTGRHRRAPSPMGERILKGHFDGFNWHCMLTAAPY